MICSSGAVDKLSMQCWVSKHQPPWFLSFDTQFESNTSCKLHDSWYYLYVGFLRYFWQWIPAGLIFVILSPACWCPPVGLPKWPGLQMASLASTWVSRTQRFLQCLSQLLCGPIKTKSDDLEKESLDPLDMNEFKHIFEHFRLTGFIKKSPLGFNWSGFLWSKSCANKWIWRQEIVHCMQSWYLLLHTSRVEHWQANKIEGSIQISSSNLKHWRMKVS